MAPGVPWEPFVLRSRVRFAVRLPAGVPRVAACGGLAALMLLGLPCARADGPAGLRDAHGDAALLQSIQEAALHQSFSGTIVYRRGDEMHASRVVQSLSGGESRERVLTLDGQLREFIRQGEEVQCLYPQLHRVVIEHGGMRSFPAFAAAEPADVLAHYQLERGGQERVAQRMCDVISLVPRDKMRYGYKLCVDPASGLLFKAQTLDERGELLEQVAFTDVRIGEPIDPAQLRPSWSTAGWQIERRTGESQATELSQQGWSVTPPSGFRRLVEVMRKLIRGTEQRPALQAVYSDGLATVSVFIEPGAPPIDDAVQTQQRGPITAVSRQVGDARVTVVGEVPPSTARSFAESVVHNAPPH